MHVCQACKLLREIYRRPSPIIYFFARNLRPTIYRPTKKLPMCNRSVNEEHTKKYRSVLSCRCFGFFSAGRSQKDWFISFECSGLGWLARFTGPSKYFRHLAPFSETPHMVFSLPLRIFLTTSANGDLVYGVMGDF
jgi:hypothetical protein